jgi:DNA-binding IclR family transcriptional regulator
MVRLVTGESVLERAVRILDAFSPDEPALLVTEIARRSGLHVATASRLIAELVDLGLLARDDDRRVRVGVRLWELGLRASPTLSLRDAAMPSMEDLHAVVGHHTQLYDRPPAESPAACLRPLRLSWSSNVAKLSSQ